MEGLIGRDLLLTGFYNQSICSISWPFPNLIPVLYHTLHHTAPAAARPALILPLAEIPAHQLHLGCFSLKADPFLKTAVGAAGSACAFLAPACGCLCRQSTGLWEKVLRNFLGTLMPCSSSSPLCIPWQRMSGEWGAPLFPWATQHSWDNTTKGVFIKAEDKGSKENIIFKSNVKCSLG